MPRTAKKFARRVGRSARGLHLMQKQVKAMAQAFVGWPRYMSQVESQVATLTAIVSVYQDELEKLGVKELKDKFLAKATEMASEFMKQAEAANEPKTQG